MSNRPPSLRRYWFLAAALLVATGGAASVGRTQQVTGSIGASITILEPVAAPSLRVTGLDVGRDGTARIETLLPPSSSTSQLVMASVSSSTPGFTPMPQPPVLVTPSSGETRMRYLVRIGRDRQADTTRPMALRVQYLIVAAGT